MNHPDFRIGGRIFASLGYPDDAHAMVKLSPAQQAHFIAKAPATFFPSAGAWGRQGSTNVHLKPAQFSLVGAALVAAASPRRWAKRKSESPHSKNVRGVPSPRSDSVRIIGRELSLVSKRGAGTPPTFSLGGKNPSVQD